MFVGNKSYWIIDFVLSSFVFFFFFLKRYQHISFDDENQDDF